MQEDIIEFVKLEKRFCEYFGEESNRQILFSGPFGSGKTTFLKNFFESRSGDFDIIHIFPVNYSLHSNTDVYEILKYDIILELIGKGVFRENDISDLTKFLFVTSQSADRAFGKLISLFSKTGKRIKDAVDLIGETYDHSVKEVGTLSDPLLGIRAFGDLIQKLKGYEYEDYITSIIKEKLQGISPETVKEKVLIVDDLDRIDPDHLFRIISVFSSHIDHHTDENKFGFDRIIFVGDIQNIKGMFVYKYGMKNTFNAFISKLSSKTPFNFDPANELFLGISKIINHYKVLPINHSETMELVPESHATRRKYFTYILSALISSGSISLRDLQKSKRTAIPVSTAFINELNVTYLHCDIYLLTRFLDLLIPHEEILPALQKLEDSPLPVTQIINNDRFRAGPLLSALSTLPLSILMNEELRNRDNRDKTLDLHLGMNSTKVNMYSRNFEMECCVPESLVSEKLLMSITIAAIRKLYQIID